MRIKNYLIMTKTPERIMSKLIGFLDPQPNEPMGTLHCIKCKEVINIKIKHTCATN